MLDLKDQVTKQSWNDDKSIFDVPRRKITVGRVGLHLLFWTWNAFSAYNALDRVLRVDPKVAPDPTLLQLMYITHLGTTIILFYLYGYLVVPSLMKQLIYYRATRQFLWPKILFAILSTASVFLIFNVYDYYLFPYAATHFKPVPAYIQRYTDLLVASGPLGIFNDYSVLTFLWAYNVSYIMLPLLLRIIREAIAWGVESAKQKEQNRILIQNQLQMLQNQINPHFLFNVFNNIYALIQRSNREAAELLRKLSQLMRYTLYHTNDNFVPLADELQFISNYVEIEQSRHFAPERIKLIQTGNPQTFLIPPLLLVTFIENAFKHGLNSISSDEAWVQIEIAVQSEESKLQVHVSNFVSPENESSKLPGGVGLSNANKRLQLLFGKDQYKLEIHRQSTIFKVFLTIPLKAELNYEYQANY